MIAKKEDDDDLVDTDIYREINYEESEERDQIKERKEDNLESDKSETDVRAQRENQELDKKGNDDDLVDTDIYQETNDEESEEMYQIEESK